MNELMTQEDRETTLALAQSFIKNVNDDIQDIKKRFFRIGFYLSEANSNKYFEVLGYSSIEELAEAEFDIKKSTAYDLMKIYDRFHSYSFPQEIREPYDDYSQSQLRELCRAKYAIGFSQIVKPTDTVEDVKKFVSTLNKYYYNSRWRSDFKSIDEVFETFEITRKKQIAAPAPEPQLNLIELAGEPAEQEQPQLANECTRVENTGEDFEFELEEPAEELEELPESNCYDGEDYSQYDEECTRVENVSDDEAIKVALKAGTNYSNSKFKIYEKFQEQPLKSEFLSFVQKEYGLGHFSIKDYGSSGCTNLKGMYITKPSGKEIFLPWAYVTGRISRLIETNEYLTVEEHARFVEWKAEQDGLIVNVAKPNKPEPEEPKRLNLKNDKARREWLDNFRSWGVWLEVPQVDKTFYRFEFANGAVLIIEVGFEYWEFSTNKQPQERVSYSVIDDEHPKFNSQGESYTSVLQWLTKHGKEV